MRWYLITSRSTNLVPATFTLISPCSSLSKSSREAGALEVAIIPQTCAMRGWLVRRKEEDWGDDDSPSSSENVVRVELMRKLARVAWLHPLRRVAVVPQIYIYYSNEENIVNFILRMRKVKAKSEVRVLNKSCMHNFSRAFSLKGLSMERPMLCTLCTKTVQCLSSHIPTSARSPPPSRSQRLQVANQL